MGRLRGHGKDLVAYFSGEEGEEGAVAGHDARWIRFARAERIISHGDEEVNVDYFDDD